MNKHGHQFPLFVSSKPRCHAEFHYIESQVESGLMKCTRLTAGTVMTFTQVKRRVDYMRGKLNIPKHSRRVVKLQPLRFILLQLETIKGTILKFQQTRGGSRGRVQRGCTPFPPEMTCGFLIQLVFCNKMWFRPKTSQLSHSLVVYPLLKKSCIRLLRPRVRIFIVELQSLLIKD